MENYASFLPAPVVSALGWTLLHALWQGTLLALLGLLGFFLTRHRPASLRYGLGMGLLAAQLPASLATFWYYLSHTATAAGATGGWASAATRPVGEVLGQPQPLPLTAQLGLWVQGHLPELVTAWLVGAGLLLLRVLGSWLYVQYLRRGARPVADPLWQQRLGTLARRLQLPHAPRLCESTLLQSPLVIGALRPVVLLPVGLLTGFSVAQVEAILAHELAHIRRHDYLVNLLQSLVEVVFFFHPALWWLSGRIRAEREHCCDDLAVAAGGDARALAHALVRVAEWQSGTRLAVAFASPRPLLLQRVRRVLGLAPRPEGTLPLLPLLLVVAGLLLGVSVYAVEQKQAKKAETAAATKATGADSPAGAFTTSPLASADTLPAAAEEQQQQGTLGENDAIASGGVAGTADFTFDHDWQFSGIDTLREQQEAIHRRMEALHKHMEPLQQRMEELHLSMEKHHFEQERFGREQEKIDWKKEKVMEAREQLLRKRTNLLHPNPKAAKLAEAEVEKQLARIEEQIQAQEQEIAQLNTQLAEARKAAEVAGEPARRTELAMQKLSEQMEVLSRKVELEARNMEKYLPAPPPPPAPHDPPRPPKNGVPSPKGTVAPPAPPAPEAPRKPREAATTPRASGVRTPAEAVAPAGSPATNKPR
jgi:bla regulator protein blaR1